MCVCRFVHVCVHVWSPLLNQLCLLDLLQGFVRFPQRALSLWKKGSRGHPYWRHSKPFLGSLPHDPETLKDKQKKCVCFKSFSKLYLMSVFPWLVCDMRSQSNSPWHFNFQQIKRPYHSFLDVIRWYDVIRLASTHCLHSKYQCLH